MRKQRMIKVSLIAAGLLALAVGIGVFFLKGGWNATCTKAEFEEVVRSTNKDTLGGAFYRGRRNGYDYFRATWNVGAKNLRVPVADSPITRSFPYTSDQEQWCRGTFMGLEGEGLSAAIDTRLNAE
jgi:hypothetical protein